jgi:cold shock CspA family protein
MQNGFTAGVVVNYDRVLRYGWIAPLDGDGPDVFVHFSHIVGEPDRRYLVRGQKCAYKPQLNPKNGKLMATSVIPLADPLIIPTKAEIAIDKLGCPDLGALGAPNLDALGSKSKTGGNRER